jgi:O-antigen/teichoic acid export membrane protein
LRKELSVPAQPYWDRTVIKRFTILFAIFAAWATTGGISGLVESTVLRQRLPDLDSAGYYMATRFSEIASYFFSTLSFTLFPYTADMAAKGKDMRPLILKASFASIVFGAVVALPFFFIAKPILSMLPHGTEYAAYWWVIPWCIGISAISFPLSLYTTAEVSAQRFGFLKWLMPLDLVYPAVLLFVTGYGYLVGIIPESWTTFLAAHNVRTLETMLWWMTAASAIKLACCLFAMFAPSRIQR